MGHASKRTSLRWRRPASMAAFAAAVLLGVIAFCSNMAAIATHDWRWFLVSGLGFLAFLGLVAYGLAANNARERAERRRSGPLKPPLQEPPSEDAPSGRGRDAR